MKQIICDRCGDEGRTQLILRPSDAMSHSISRDFDLCHKCTVEVMAFVNGKALALDTAGIWRDSES